MSDKIDISPEAVEQLARDLPNSQWQAPNLHLARETLRALRARLAEVEKELVEMTAAKEIHQTRRAEYFDRAERAEAALATAKEDENYDWTDDVPYRSDKGELVLRVEHILTEPVCATACLLWENTGEVLEGFQADTRSEVSKRAVDWAKEHFRALANEAETSALGMPCPSR